jgi:glyoxylate utilization-related uncharacterized protein
MITVLEVTSVLPRREGDAEVTRFLNAQTVGAQGVEGMAYRLAPGAMAGPFREAGAHQLFYVTAGSPEAEYGGSRHPLGPGRGVYCEPGEGCAFTNAGGEPAAFYRFIVPA